MTKVSFAILLVACTSILLPVGSSGAQSPQDEEAIRHIERLWDEAWNQHDPQALAALLAEDADFVNVTGTLYRGREAFEHLMMRTHQMQFKDSTRHKGLELMASSVRSVRRASGMEACGNTSGIQVLDEPLELSVVTHSTA
jgi:hypothetical protein